MSELNRCVYLTTALFFLSTPSHAMQKAADGSAVKDSDDAAVLEVVTVTARFREETVQDIGASITGISGEDLARNAVANLDDLTKSMVGINNLRLTQNDNEISIRGVSNLGVSIFTSSSVFTVSVDDVSVASNFGQRDFGIVDLDRVELIRGPQPTLFGESAVGGVIRYFTRDPELSGPTFTGSSSAQLESIKDGGLGTLFTSANSLILVPEKVGLRLSGYYTKDEGYIDNRLDGEDDANDFDSFGGRAVLLMQPNDRLSARFSAFIARDEHGISSAIEPGTDPKALVFGIPGLADDAFPNFGGDGSDDIDLYSAKVSYDFGRIEVSSITGFYERDRQDDGLNVGITVLAQSFFPTITTTTFGSDTFAEQTFSEELRVVSNFDGPLNFTAGAYYRDRDITGERSLVIPELPAVSTPSTDLAQQNVTKTESSQASGFAEFTWSATPRLRLIGGVRYVSDTFTSSFGETVINLNPSNAPWTPTNPIDFLSVTDVLTSVGVPPPYEFKLDEFLPRGAIEFDVSDDILLYANVARGIRNGGVGQPLAALASSGNPADPNFFNKFADNLFYDSDSVVSVDGGVKAVWLDGSLITNLGLFHTKYKDGQIAVLVPTSNTVNGPDQVISGIELETKYRWTDKLTTFLNATFLDSEFQEDFSLSGQGIDIRKGNEAVNAPHLTFSLGYDFSMPLNGQWRVVSGADFHFLGKRFSDPANFPSGELDSLEILNLRFGFESDRMSLTAFVRNVLNDVEAISASASLFDAIRDENGVAIDSSVISEEYVNQPRSIGLSFTFRY
jgi:iron complex outermembrane recepter protein